MSNEFKPYHINATSDDFLGNGDVGRYLLIPGSGSRASLIADQLNNVIVKEHPRGHHLYLGEISAGDQTIDVATISSGMGCPSMEIILHELYSLGASRFLRLGTSGSLQPNYVKLGDFVNVEAAVRDEATTQDYLPLSFPAYASYEFNHAIRLAAEQLGSDYHLHSGMAHCKSSFYAREFGAGPLGKDNLDFLSLLTRAGVLATEMETATLFIQSKLYDHEQKLPSIKRRVLCGAILAVISVPPHHLMNKSDSMMVEEKLIKLGLETIRVVFNTID